MSDGVSEENPKAGEAYSDEASYGGNPQLIPL